MAKDGIAVPVFFCPELTAAFRRQAKTCCGDNPLLRAIAETFAPGCVAAATILSFADADQRRRGVSGLASRRETSASINSKLLVLDLCSDCKSFLPNTPAERTKIIELGGYRYTGPPDRLHYTTAIARISFEVCGSNWITRTPSS
jgi:hypothetical protein